MSRGRGRQVRRSGKEQRDLVARFESSGLGARQFCLREGVSPSSLQRWRRLASSTRPAGFVELLPARSSAVPAIWAVEIVLPNGACFRFRE